MYTIRYKWNNNTTTYEYGMYYTDKKDAQDAMQELKKRMDKMGCGDYRIWIKKN